jgi:Predicted amidohydrolase
VNRVGIESVERRTENGEFATALEGIADTTAEANSKLYTLHSGIPFWGTSFIAGPQGELLYEAPTDQEVEVVVDVDIQRSEHVRRWWPFLRDRRIDDYDGLTKRFIEEN